MNKLKQRIEKFLVDSRKYLSSPSLSISNKLSANISEVFLKIKSLSCIRKNELSTDEIVILGFWLLEHNGEINIEGIIHLSHKFSEEGEEFTIGLTIPLIPDRDNATFCFMVYEKDIPILFDQHDPIGLVTFHQNGSTSVYQGDFRSNEHPLTYAFNFSRSNEIELDAGDDGCYRLKYTLSKVESDN